MGSCQSTNSIREASVVQRRPQPSKLLQDKKILSAEERVKKEESGGSLALHSIGLLKSIGGRSPSSKPVFSITGNKNSKNILSVCSSPEGSKQLELVGLGTLVVLDNHNPEKDRICRLESPETDLKHSIRKRGNISSSISVSNIQESTLIKRRCQKWPSIEKMLNIAQSKGSNYSGILKNQKASGISDHEECQFQTFKNKMVSKNESNLQLKKARSIKITQTSEL